MSSLLPLFLKGAFIGLSIAAPIGPISLLCMRRTIAHGLLIGLASSFGVATADAVYGIIAAGGFTVISNFLVAQQTLFQLIGGLALTYLGITIFLSKSITKLSPSNHNTNIFSAFFSISLLTLANPMTILFFASVIAGINISGTESSMLAMISVVTGIFVGCLLWMVFLVSAVAFTRHQINEQVMWWINKISGLCILGFALSVIVTLLK